MVSPYKDVPVKEIWDEFARSGVTDTLTILDYVATALTGQTPPELLFGRSKTLDRLIMELRLSRQRDARVFLNDYLFFVSQAHYPTGLFPLPRHLAGAMVQLVGVGNNDRVLDLACGTGGLLVASGRAGAEHLQGYDIDERMVRIAQHNLRLNCSAVPSSVVRADAAARSFLQDDGSHTVVLLAPPFGANTFDRNRAEAALGHGVSRIENALYEMALGRLSAGGRAAFLGLARLLSGGDSADRRFRKQMVEEFRLKSVIRLPGVALQPFYPTQVYLVLVEKRSPSDKDIVWFATAHRDGYGTSKRERRLTEQPDAERNDYLLLQALLTTKGTPEPNSCLGEGRPVITMANIRVPEREAHPWLHVITPEPNQWLVRGLLDQVDGVPHLYLEVAEQSPAAPHRYVAVQLGLDKRAAEVAKEKVPKEADVLFDQPIPNGAIAVSRTGIVVAVGRKRTVLTQQLNSNDDVDLRPETYLPQPPSGMPTQDTPTELLTRIRTNEGLFRQSMDRLYGHVVYGSPRRDTAPEVPKDLIAASFPMGTPSPVQLTIWKAIQKLEHAAQGENGGARFFTLRDLEREVVEQPIVAAIGATLELLCRAGSIVPVTLRQVPGYRLTTNWDTWTPIDPNERRGDGNVAEGTEGA